VLFPPQRGNAFLCFLCQGPLVEPTTQFSIRKSNDYQVLRNSEEFSNSLWPKLFRDVLVAGARACGLELTTLPDKSALDDATKKLGLTRARLDAHLATLGRSAGSPWGKDQKEAAAAALVALKRPKRGSLT